MIKIRIQVEEMHVYYYIAKNLISSAKLGFMGFMSSPEEKLINNIYHAKDADEVADLSRKLFDKLEDEKTELKLNTSHDNLRDIEELIGEAVGYTNNLLFKAEVLENVSKTLKNDLTTHEKIMLCVDKITQAKRVLMGLSPEERKNVLDGKGFEITPKKKKNAVKAVDAENVENVTEVSEINEDNSSEEIEEVNESFKENNDKSGFTAQDVPVTPIEHYMVDKPENSEQSLIDKKLEKIEEEAEVLDWDDEDSVEEIVEDSTKEEVAVSESNFDDFEEITLNVEVEDDSEEFEEITLNVEVEDDSEEFEEITLNVEVEDDSEEFEEITLNVEVEDEELPPINIIEPTPLEERLYPSDIGFEPPMVYPAEDVSIEHVEEEINSEVIVEDNTDFFVPEIFKIIERDGIEVDEDVK